MKVRTVRFQMTGDLQGDILPEATACLDESLFFSGVSHDSAVLFLAGLCEIGCAQQLESRGTIQGELENA